MMEMTGFPRGYKPEHFRRDQDLFHKWVRENHPNCVIVGPCTTDASAVQMGPNDKGGAGVGDVFPSCTTGELMDGCTEKLDVFRTLNELGEFATVTDGVIFHNTLASSDYGFLQHGTFEPRPNYFAALLWNTLMGTTVFDSGIEISEGSHVFAHSRKDGKDGVAYLVINNSTTEETVVTLPKDADAYVLSADGLRARTMKLNGNDLVLGENDELPALTPVKVAAGETKLAPATMAFYVM